MKNLLFTLAIASLFLTSCESVDSKHVGVAVSYGGETDMSKVYPEGMVYGMRWLTDDMIQYNVAEQTFVTKIEFNDKNNMVVPIEFSIDYNISATQANKLHKGIDNYMVKLEKTIKSAAADIIPKYSAVEINLLKRSEIESKMKVVLEKELAAFYLVFARIQMTDVDLPVAVSKLAEETAIQIGRNEKATKLKAEKVAVADALIAESKGKFEAAEFDVKTKELMSRPAVLSLYKAETDRVWASKGVSPFGNNNIFGSDAATVIRGLK
jgi:hypothetical protein